ncbi:MAG: hypothetical protein ACRESW_04015, partial [Nevskiales bacterium]
MFNGIAIRVFPTLLMPAFACSCAFALTAADSPSGHPSTGPAGSDLTLSSQEDFSPNYVSADLLVFTARYLESTHTSIEAAARILTAVRQDFLDWEDGEKAQKLIQWYVNLDPYDRAVY